MSNNHVCRQLAFGALAGLAGTMVLQTVRKINERYVSQAAEPPIKEHPGKFMVQQAERLLPEQTQQRIPEEAKRRMGDILGLCYGATFGAVYAILRPRGGPRLVDGAWFGLVTWSAGYLGWLPASGLMPPIWKHEVKQMAKPIAEHAVYGMATVAAYDWMTAWAQRRQTFLERFKEAITA